MAHELNPAQLDAVRTLRGPLLVLAGAGTGKTRVVTYRIAALIRGGTKPERILAVTFTKKAAAEMQQRAAALLALPRGRGCTRPGLPPPPGRSVGLHRPGEDAIGTAQRRRVARAVGPRSSGRGRVSPLSGQ